MKQKIALSLLLIFSLFIVSGCGNTNDNGSETKTSSQKSGIEDVCNYFPKELVEKALGKSIPQIETVDLVDPTCNYYTSYEDNYERTYSGKNKPGGPKIVVVYDTKDFAKDRISNEKSGSTYTPDPSIGMDNFVVTRKGGEIWLVALSLGDEKYIRLKAIDEAVTGEELVKIAKEFAAKIKK